MTVLVVAFVHIYIYIYIYVCVCVCVCVYISGEVHQSIVVNMLNSDIVVIEFEHFSHYYVLFRTWERYKPSSSFLNILMDTTK